MLSIVVPVLNEASVIDELLEHTLGLPGDFELIVADGGSTDETTSRAAAHDGVTVVSTKPGRAVQMNAGAAAAHGDILLFLHADCLLPRDAVFRIEQAINDGKVDGGAFRINLGARWIYRILAGYSNFRSRHFGFFLGDHGIFVRADVFKRLGGYADIDLMEDLDFSRRLRKFGPWQQLDATITVSPRRFEAGGIWRTILKMQLLHALYAAGVAPATLRKHYPDVR